MQQADDGDCQHRWVPVWAVRCTIAAYPRSGICTAVAVSWHEPSIPAARCRLPRSVPSQALALPSDGARQSPRGDSEPPALTFGPFGIAERLNWLNAKKRRRNTSSQWRIVARS